MVKWLINNFWIKVISLALAIITWFYVKEELTKERQLTKQFYKSSIINQATRPFFGKEKKPANKGYLMNKNSRQK